MTVIQTIVVPLDDSLEYPRTLRTAFSLAERSNCAVSLVRSCPADQADGITQWLREVGARFTEVAPHSVRVLEGPPAEAVLNATPAENAMICMRTHGRSGLSRLVFGSVAEDLIRRSSQPILCVGPDVTDIALPNEHIQALVCTDDSVATGAVVAGAATFAEAVDASCLVAQVVGPDEDIAMDGGPPPRPLRDQAERHCQQAVDQLTAAGIPATAEVLPGHAASSIVDHAHRRASSFIVVGASGRSGLARYTLGSVATAVVRHARCPVLVVPTWDDVG